MLRLKGRENRVLRSLPNPTRPKEVENVVIWGGHKATSTLQSVSYLRNKEPGEENGLRVLVVEGEKVGASRWLRLAACLVLRR